MDNSTAIKQRAQSFIKRCQFEKAMAEYQRLLDASEVDPGTYILIGDLHIKMDEDPEALERYGEAVEGYQRVGLDRNAIAVLKKILRVDGKHRIAHARLAKLYEDKGLLAESFAHHLEHASICLSDHDAEEAMRVLKALEELDTPSARLAMRVADLIDTLVDTPSAVADLERRARQLEGRGRAEQARTLIERARELDPTGATASEQGVGYGNPDDASDFDGDRRSAWEALNEGLRQDAEGSAGDDSEAAANDDSENVLPGLERSGGSLFSLTDPEGAETDDASGEVVPVIDLNDSVVADESTDGPERNVEFVSESDVDPTPVFDLDAPTDETDPTPVFDLDAPTDETDPTPAFDLDAPADETDPTPVFDLDAPTDETDTAPVFDLDAPTDETATTPVFDLDAPSEVAEDESVPVYELEIEGEPNGESPVELEVTPEEPDAAHAQSFDLATAVSGHADILTTPASGEVALDPESLETFNADTWSTAVDQLVEQGKQADALDCLLDWAQQAELSGADRDAIRLYERLWDLEHSEPGVARHLTAIYEGLGDLQNAARWRVEVGELRLQAGEWDDARIDFEEALRLDPDHELARRRLDRLAHVEPAGEEPVESDTVDYDSEDAPVAGALGDPMGDTEIEDALSSVLPITPVSSDADGTGAIADDAQLETAEAVSGDRDPLADTPTPPSRGLGPEQVAQILDRFVEDVGAQLGDEDHSSHYDLALAFVEMGLDHEAIDQLLQALDNPDFRDRCLELLSTCYSRIGEPERAAEHLSAALTQLESGDPREADLRVRLSTLLTDAGETEQAREVLRQVIDRHPSHVDAQRRLEALGG